MVSEKSKMVNLKEVKNWPKTRLPNGKSFVITHTSDVVLKNSMVLKEVEYVLNLNTICSL